MANNGGKGFERKGRPNVERPKNVVPFNAERINQAIELAARRFERERIARLQPQKDESPKEPTPDEIEPEARRILDETKGCDYNIALKLQANLLNQYRAQQLELGDFVRALAHMTEDDVINHREYCYAIATTFAQLNAERRNIQSPL